MSQKRAVLAMSGDPITIGHEHVVKIAADLVSHVTLGIGINSDKRYLFSDEERVEMAEEAVKRMNLKNVTVKFYSGLLFEFARQEKAKYLIRGLRTVSDFDYEFTLNDFNKTYDHELETLFVMAPKEFLTVSSTNVRAAAKYGLSVNQWVNPFVAQKLREKFE